jgi:hypothetical protein
MHSNKPNIFGQVANNEDRITALLYNFLYYKAFRDAFAQKIGLQPSDIMHQDFSLQFRTEDCGIPDLRLSNDKVEYLFEVKVYDYRELTENQPEGYLEYLESSSLFNKRLYLLAPRSYKHRKDFFERSDTFKQKKNSTTLVASIYWEDIIQILEEEELANLSPLFAEFSDFLKNWFKHIDYRDLNLELMYHKEYAQSLRKLYELVDELYKNLAGADIELTMSNKLPNEYGFYLHQGAENEIYFGNWLPVWEEHGYPLTLTTNKMELKDKFIKFCADQNLPILDEDFSGWIVAGIPQHIMPTEKEGAEKIQTLLNNFAKYSSNI